MSIKIVDIGLFRDSTFMKRKRLHFNSNIEMRIRQLENIHLTSCMSRIAVAYFWMHNNRPDLLRRTFEDIKLMNELECFMVLKGLVIFDLHIDVIKAICRETIGFKDTPKLAAQLTLFHPPKPDVVRSLLLKEDKSATVDGVTQYLKYLASMSLSHLQILDVLNTMQFPERYMHQVCINLHHANEDQSFYIILLTLSQGRISDLVPLVSRQPSSASAVVHLSHALISFLEVGLAPLIPFMLSRITEPGFTPTKISRDEWIMRMVNLREGSFSEEEFCSIISAMTLQLRGKILRTCCDRGTRLDFLKQIVLISYNEGVLPGVFAEVLKQVGTLNAPVYIDDCLLHACQDMPGVELLALIRELADAYVISEKLEKQWLIVGYARRSDTEVVMSMLQELYPSPCTAYFGAADLGNLVTLLKKEDDSETVISELEFRLEKLNELQTGLDKAVSKKDLDMVVQQSDVNLLQDNFCSVVNAFGIHATVYALHHVSEGLQKESNHLTQLLCQLESAEDFKSFAKVFIYYGFLLPPNIKSYGLSLLKNELHSKVGFNSVMEAQMYLYSYSVHMDITQELLDSLSHIKDNHIANILLAHCILHPRAGAKLMAILANKRYQKTLGKSERNLFKFLNAKMVQSERVKFVKVVVSEQLKLYQSR